MALAMKTALERIQENQQVQHQLAACVAIVEGVRDSGGAGRWVARREARGGCGRLAIVYGCDLKAKSVDSTKRATNEATTKAMARGQVG